MHPLYMRLVFIISFFCSTMLQAQTYMVSGVVTDNFDNEGVEDVYIRLNSPKGQILDTTDRKGVYAFSYKSKVGDVLFFDHVGFETYNFVLTKKVMRKVVEDTLYINAKLTYKTLAPLKIKDPFIPDTAYGSTEHSISDYEFYEDKFVMLAYDQTLKKGSKILFVDANKEILSTKTIPIRALDLYKDFKGQIYVIGAQDIYAVRIFGNKISLDLEDKSNFDKYIAPVVEAKDNYLYYSNFNRDFPSFEYYAYNVVDSSHHELLTVEDDLIMELYMAEYKYVDGAEKVWAMNKENETGIDKEIWIGLKYFTNSVYYKPLYAPMFLIDDAPVVFDHYKNEVIMFNEAHQKIASSPIFYHLLKGKKKWAKEVIKDQVNDRLYALMDYEGYHVLMEINPETGETTNAHKLFFKYSEQVQIKNNKIYYIYRPFESLQKKFLYTEKITF